MNKLLTANFIRLKKSKIFWLCMVFMFCLALIVCNTYYREKQMGWDMILNNGVFNYAMFTGILSAVFCSLFVGTEYSDGTIRNKIVIGHARTAVYLANLTVCSAAGLLMCFAYLIPYLAVGTPLLGWFRPEIKYILLFFLDSLMLSIAFSAIFTLIAMLCQNKAAAAATCILLAFIFLFSGIQIQARLDEPKTYGAYTFMNESGDLISEDEEPNPRYLEGTKRKVYEFINDFFPGGQQTQISQMSGQPGDPILLLAVYSGIIIILTTGAGIFFFRRKDLK